MHFVCLACVSCAISQHNMLEQRYSNTSAFEICNIESLSWIRLKDEVCCWNVKSPFQIPTFPPSLENRLSSTLPKNLASNWHQILSQLPPVDSKVSPEIWKGGEGGSFFFDTLPSDSLKLAPAHLGDWLHSRSSISPIVWPDGQAGLSGRTFWPDCLTGPSSWTV